MGKSQFVLAMAVLLAGCGKDAGEGVDTAAVAGRAVAQAEDVPTDVDLPDGPWRDLAHRLVTARSLDASVDATREILARGGIATHDGERVLVAAQGPAATFNASPRETVHLAMEARRRPNAGRLTIEELAQMLEGFGFPFPDADPDGQAQGAVDRLRPGDPGSEEDTGTADDAARDAQHDESRAREEALIAQLQDITRQWQLARQAVNKAAPAERAAARAEVDRLWGERNAVIAQRRDAQLQASAGQDALRERRMEMQDLADRLARVQRQVGADPVQGERLMALLDAWVREAAKTPDDPRSFTPLFLAEMARLQDAPVDLTGSAWTRPGRGKGAPVDLRGAPRARQLRWTLLELELFGAAFDRGRNPRTAARVVPSLQRVATALAGSLVPPARAGNACIDYKEAYGDTWGEIASAAGGWGVGQALERGVEAATGSATREAFGKAMGAVGIATKLAKLASFYADKQVSVEPEPLSRHKPLDQADTAIYVARAGVNEADLKEYERMIGEGAKADRMARDCLNSLGLPTFSTLKDIADDAENWIVEWRTGDGEGNHIMESRPPYNKWDWPGRRAMRMHRESPSSARANLFVDVLPEQKHSGTVVRAYATAQASVDAAGMPSLGTFVTGAAGGLGLADALVELFGGWFQYMNMPKAYGTIELEYHCPRPTTLHRASKAVADGGGDDGPDECLIAAGKAD